MDLGHGVGETGAVSMAGGGKFRRRGSVRGDVCGLGEGEKGAFGALGEMWWEGEGLR